MKMFKKVLSAVTASALTLSMAAGSAAMFSSVTAADIDSMTAMELVEDMGAGWNLGNSFDCTNTWTNPLTIDAIETAWGNPVTTQSIIDSVAFYGFNTVRIPVTWYQMSDSSGNIDEAYLARIKEVVDYCYANDMYVIINIHHDGLTGAEGGWLADAGVNGKARFTTMWKQIATYFKDYDRHLAFEAWNEIDWDYSTIQTMGQAFVDTVRSAGGNYNDDRLLIIPGKATNFENTVSSSFVMPTDSANMLAVDIHYYDPTTYTVYSDDDDSWGYGMTPQNTWGSDSEVAKVKNDFLQMQSRFTSQGIPVIIGEYGVENYNKPDDQGRVLFTETVASEAYNADGICAVLWDSSNGGDMKYYDRVSQVWLNTEIGEFYKKLNGGTYADPDTGLILTDRITLTGTQEESANYGLSDVVIDISSLKDKAVIKEAIWSVDVTGLTDAGYYGQVAVQANLLDDATGTDRQWAYSKVSIANESDVYTTSTQEWYHSVDNVDTLFEGYSLEYDYIKFGVWYVGSDGTAPTVAVNPNVTLVFETPIWVTPDYQIPTEEETTEPETTEPETTEPETTEPETTEPETTEPTEDESGEDTSDVTGEIVYGDLSCDGKVTIVDVIMINKGIMGAETLSDAARANGDVNRDGGLTNSDSLNILKSLVKLVTLPVA